MKFTFEEERKILEIARVAIEHHLNNWEIPELPISEVPDNLKAPGGAFVTIYKGRRLRGCIGRMHSSEPLFRVVQHMAVSAASHDSRFDRLEADELKDINIEVSVLGPLEKMKSINDIKIGRDGVYVRKGASSGTFLPQVAERNGWTAEEFLSRCARDKAHIGWDGWREAEVYIYQTFTMAET